ncbi:efflux RND transporter periplasmic adaptor subunit [Chloroflexota bacterium]
MRRPIIMKIMTIALLLSLILSGATACGGGDTGEANGQQAIVVRGDLSVSVTGDGRIEASRQVRLTFGSAGTVEEINVNEGDRVTAGQTLAKLDTTFLEQAVTTAKQAVTTAEQAVTTSEQSVTTAELTVEANRQSVKAAELMVTTADIAVKIAEIDLELAQNSHQQMITPYPYVTHSFNVPDILAAVRDAQEQITNAQAELRKASEGGPYLISEVTNPLAQAQDKLTDAEKKLVYGLGEGTKPIGLSYWTLRASQLAVDKAQMALDKAGNDLANAGNNVDVAVNNLDKTINNLEIARNNLDNTRNNLEISRNNLDKANDALEKATIVAPFDGVVASVNAEEEETVSSVETIVYLVDPGTMELVVELDEIDLPGIKVGQETIITVDALHDMEFKGTVSSIYPVPITLGGIVLYNIKINLDVPGDSEVKVGMSASADIILSKRSDALLVPVRAVIEDNQGNPIVKVVVNDQVEERPVVVGISDSLQTEIISGLTEGELILIELRSKSQETGGFGF